MSTADDPRESSAETRLTFPDAWQTDSPDGLSASVMFISGLVMVTRNRFLAWPSLLLTLNSVINQHPLRTKEGGNGSSSQLLLAASALVASYLPLFMINAPQSVTQTPLSIA